MRRGDRFLGRTGGVAGAVLFFIAAAGFTPTTATAWTGYNVVTILQVTTYMPPSTSLGVIIKFSPVTQHLEGCSDATGHYAWIDLSQADGKATYASVLAAHLAGRSIDIGVHGCSADGIPRVYAITLHP